MADNTSPVSYTAYEQLPIAPPIPMIELTSRVLLLSLCVPCLSAGCAAAGGSPDLSKGAQDASVDVPADALVLDQGGGQDDVISLPEAEAGDGAPPVEEPYCDNKDLTGDLDHDGWSVQDGDCNDCTPLMNPGAYDYPGGVDEDCDGTPDNEPTGCDDGLAIDANNPMDAAKAMDLCRIAKENAPLASKTWGLISARYVFPDGSVKSRTPKANGTNCVGTGGLGNPPNPLSHGILTSFGKNVHPTGGSSMAVLSSGAARFGADAPSPSGAHMCTASKAAPGFPVASNSCPGQHIDSSTNAYDGMALELKIRVPTNAKAMSFDFDFYTYEYPVYICSQYNDFFVALMSGGGVTNKNVSYDAKGNPVSVNNGFLEVCPAGDHGGKHFDCSLGMSELDETGFEGHGATSWLRTTVPVKGGEVITLRFAIWDSGDDGYDSTVLLDHLKWEVEPLPPQTVRPPR